VLAQASYDHVLPKSEAKGSHYISSTYRGFHQMQHYKFQTLYFLLKPFFEEFMKTMEIAIL
jgi:hypothetical protein